MNLQRRNMLALLAALAEPQATAQTAAPSHEPFGPLRPPLPAPRLLLTADDGKRVELTERLRGRVTALQLMFTGCSATCPIQGALFAEVQRLLKGTAAHLRLLSISIDPLGDTQPM